MKKVFIQKRVYSGHHLVRFNRTETQKFSYMRHSFWLRTITEPNENARCSLGKEIATGQDKGPGAPELSCTLGDCVG